MRFVLRWAVLVVLVAIWAGCSPVSQAPVDEERESHFLAGKAHVQSGDFDSALEDFEKALEINPHSSSAFFELAVIYDEQKKDYGAALYHYQKAARLRPTSPKAERANARLLFCKRELAKTVTLDYTVDQVQKDLDRLMVENQQLRHMVIQWQNYYHGRTNAQPLSVVSGVASNAPLVPRTEAAVVTPATRVTPTNVAGHPATPAGVARTHKVASGDTPARIAARYGIKVSALRAANPGLNDRRMRIGQTLVIPAP